MKRVGIALAGLFVLIAGAQAGPQRLLTPDDFYKLRTVDDPQIAPAGDWVAYSISVSEPDGSAYRSHVFMSRYDGSKTVQVTSRPKEDETAPRFSPDGRWLSFLSSRIDDKKNDQLWFMDRAGGEAQKVSDFKGNVGDYVWSPDGKKIAIIASDPDPNAADKDDADKPAKPIVIDRFFFMADVKGYLGKQRDHLYLFDVASHNVTQLTNGQFDDALPAWSPDSKSIAFVSKRGPDPDRTENWDVYVIAAQKGAHEHAVTTFTGEDNAPDRFDLPGYPAWSPDGKWIAYWQGGDPKMIEYATNKLAIVPSNGGTPKILTPSLDRNVTYPTWSDDGKSIQFLVEDDRTQYLARVSVNGGQVVPIVSARELVAEYTKAHDRYALLISTPVLPPEIFVWNGNGAPRQITHSNDWLKDYKLAPVHEIAFKSKDGTDVHGYIVMPPNGGSHLPAILRIHGGPQLQFDDEFDLDQQTMAAHGYAVIAVNPRGSSGRGTAYSAGIYANWGGPDVQDVLAAVDYAVKQGIADPNKLAVGGWSYGGMLTNYVIASDARFKAATSGASIADILGGYGNDEYVRDYEHELGTPWTNTATWMKVSYPFLHADRIKTPTLFLGGTDDMNVPLHNGEQMYQAEKSLGLDTELIIYPGQFHDLTTPLYLKDRLTRYLDWYDRHLGHHG
jgi:dipeptidyl aminopeptidase/acylaminoacyl peptidase